MARRGKKINQIKNAGSARDFAAGKKIGRPKQVFIDEPTMESVLDGFKGGRWEKVNGQV
jgi:hypothetical protein